MQDRFADGRRAMLDEIASTTRATARETGRAFLSERVMSAMARVPRERFVAESQAGCAYHNSPLSIGLGQTISQPFIVALMTDLLDINSGDNVLEIGTGSAYQTAILAELGAHVYTVEIIEMLGREAEQRLSNLGYTGVATRIGDGYAGWPEHAPYDGIIVTAAPEDLPPALCDQLKTGGKLVIPLGARFGAQTLYVINKRSNGTFDRRAVLGVRFVPLTRSGTRADG